MPRKMSQLARGQMTTWLDLVTSRCLHRFAKMDAKVVKRRRGGRYCVAGGPNNQSCKNTSYTEGIRMHQFPTDPVIRGKWVKFVQRNRKDFAEPISKYSALCSAHFEESCYTRRFSFHLEEMENINMNRVLIKGSVPSRATTFPASPEELTQRAKRKVSKQHGFDPDNMQFWIIIGIWFSIDQKRCFICAPRLKEAENRVGATTLRGACRITLDSDSFTRNHHDQWRFQVRTIASSSPWL